MGKNGLSIRREACRLAAITLQGQGNEGELCPRLWSITVFYEQYMRKGARRTQKDFGPKKPIKIIALKVPASTKE